MANWVFLPQAPSLLTRYASNTCGLFDVAVAGVGPEVVSWYLHDRAGHRDSVQPQMAQVASRDSLVFCWFRIYSHWLTCFAAAVLSMLTHTKPCI